MNEYDTFELNEEEKLYYIENLASEEEHVQNDLLKALDKRWFITTDKEYDYYNELNNGFDYILVVDNNGYDALTKEFVHKMFIECNTFDSLDEDISKEKHLKDYLKNGIDLIVIYSDINNAHLQFNNDYDKELYEDFDETDEALYLSFSDEQLKELTKDNIKDITNFELLDRLYKINRNILSVAQIEILKNNFRQKIIVSKEDVESLLENLKKCSKIWLGEYFKTKKFLDTNKLTEDDCLQIVKNLKVEDYYRNTRSINPNYLGNNLMIFEPSNIKLNNDKTIEKCTIYVKLDIDETTSEVVALISIHNIDKPNQRPYNFEDIFWDRDKIQKHGEEQGFNEVNLILDNNTIRPLTKEELKNKFAVSVEQASSNDYKTREELEKIAKDINAEHIMYFIYNGQYGGEYSFLVDDEDIAEKIAKKYNQKAYGLYDENGEYIEIQLHKEQINQDKQNNDLDNKINESLEVEKPKDEIEQLIDDLYELRKQSLKDEGEFGIGNLIFKEFRNLGYLKQLKDLLKKQKAKELSLENLNEALSEPDRIYTLQYKYDVPSEPFTEIAIEASDYEEAKNKLKSIKGNVILSNLNPIKITPILKIEDVYKVKNNFLNIYDYYKIVGIGKNVVSLSRYGDNKEYIGFERKDKNDFIDMLIKSGIRKVENFKKSD